MKLGLFQLVNGIVLWSLVVVVYFVYESCM